MVSTAQDVQAGDTVTVVSEDGTTATAITEAGAAPNQDGPNQDGQQSPTG